MSTPRDRPSPGHAGTPPLNGLDDRPVRWIVDDAPAFVEREVRRGRQYDGIVLDPPSYGHGPAKTAWRLEDDLPGLLLACGRLLAPDGFVLLTAHTEGYGRNGCTSSSRRRSSAAQRFAGGMAELELRSAAGGDLALGAFAKLDAGR